MYNKQAIKQVTKNSSKILPSLYETDPHPHLVFSKLDFSFLKIFWFDNIFWDPAVTPRPPAPHFFKINFSNFSKVSHYPNHWISSSPFALSFEYPTTPPPASSHTYHHCHLTPRITRGKRLYMHFLFLLSMLVSFSFITFSSSSFILFFF